MLRRSESDRWLFGVTLGLCLLGAVMIYSASAVTAGRDYGHSYYFLLRQSVWLVLGIGGMFALMRMDYRKLREPIVVYSALCAVVLMLVGAFFLDKSHATHRWIRFGFVGFQPGMRVNDCIAVPRGDKQDSLVCLTGHMGQGYLEGGVAQMLFARDYGKGVGIKYDFLLRATDSTGATGANVVTCKRKVPAYFELTKIAVGPRKDTVVFDASWADADTINTACGKGFPKPKEVFGTLAKGDAYVPAGFEKKGRVVIDLATRKVLPPN